MSRLPGTDGGQLDVERAPRDPQGTCRQRHIAVGVGNGVHHGLMLHLLEATRSPCRTGLAQPFGVLGQCPGNGRRQLGGAEVNCHLYDDPSIHNGQERETIHA